MLKINNVELDFDLMDADTAEKYENALKKLQTAKDKINGTETLGESIRTQCNMVFDFFNEIFGIGTDKKLFGNKTNLRVCLEAVETMIEYANKDMQFIQNKVNKYSPNRVKSPKFNRRK